MKKYTSIISKALLPVAVMFATWSCSDDWLRPRPLSMYTPENVFIDAAGMQTLITAAERNMRHPFFGIHSDGRLLAEYRSPLLTEYIISDMAISGSTDNADRPFNLDFSLLPTGGRLNQNDGLAVSWFWNENFAGIRNANSVITRIDDAEWNSEAERNGILGAAYFQRAWRYYLLVHQFGNVPWIGGEIRTPRTDFFTYCRWSILERLQEELEFAYQWIPERVERGRTTRAAAGVLLMKVSKSLGDFQRALEVGRELLANPNYALMTQRFGPLYTNNVPRTNLMHDLHSVEAKFDMNNREGLMFVVSDPNETPGSLRSGKMRNFGPGWDAPNSRWQTPTGVPGVGLVMHLDEEPFGPFDLNRRYGRGIARSRSSYYHLFTIWDMCRNVQPIGDVVPSGRHLNDMRGPLHKSMMSRPNLPDTLVRDSWRFPEDLIYNASALRSPTNANHEWYGRNVVRPAAFGPGTGHSTEAYIRGWFHWPHFKIFVPERFRTITQQWNGGATPWYVFRLAEVYLMMAEAYYWTDNFAQSAAMLNVVRNRAGALPLTAADIDIAAILDERARELFAEEFRSSELTRVAFTYALTGRPASVFGGRVYSLDNFSGPGGAGSNVKQEGINFFFDWVVSRNGFYNQGVMVQNTEYTISVHHVLWPIPGAAITTNTQGVINQNIGYPGAENNLPPRIVPPRGS